MSCSLEPLLDSVKVARILGVEPDTLAAWRRKGYGPRWYRIGKKIRYSESDLRAWMGAQASPGPHRSECHRQAELRERIRNLPDIAGPVLGARRD